MDRAEHIEDLLHGRTEDVDGVTYGELLRHVIRPGLSDDDVRFLLWERTPYPLVTRPDELRPYLEKIRDELQGARRG
jgi:hypothetical protein